MDLEHLFPEGDYRFHLTLRRVEPEEFFANRDASGGLLAERARWIEADPERYATIQPEGEPLRREFEQLAAAWGFDEALPRGSDTRDSTADDAIRRLGRSVEPDILFLSGDAESKIRLRGGALCFPTGWALEEKLGHTVDFIHGVVPGLNAALGPSIHQFLSRLKPDVAFLRDNWGIAATDELNLHPARQIPAPRPPTRLDRLWLRVEHQALLALPASGGIVFGIRIALHRLDSLAGTPIGKKLRSALETMPAELVSYKRLDAVRPQIVGLL